MKFRFFLFALLIFSAAGCSRNSDELSVADLPTGFEEVEPVEPEVENFESVAGKVFSSASGEKLIHAEIWRNGELHSETDLAGEFEILGVELGDILRIRKDGYVATSVFVDSTNEILEFGLAPIWELDAAGQIYPDIANDSEFEPAVRRLYENQILSATGAQNFAPEENISRAELVALAVAAAGFLPDEPTVTNFCDVAPEDDFAAAAEFLFAKNWIAGFESEDCAHERDFRPELPMSRVETAKMLFAVFGDLVDKKIAEKVCLPAGFTDVPRDAWFAEFVDVANCLGFVDGFADGTFRPDRPVTRGEIAIIFADALESLF